MKREIRESIKRMYRDPLTAYGTFDYFGEGKIISIRPDKLIAKISFKSKGDKDIRVDVAEMKF